MMSISSCKHPDTPKRAHVLALINANRNQRPKPSIFKEAGVSQAVEWAIERKRRRIMAWTLWIDS